MAYPLRIMSWFLGLPVGQEAHGTIQARLGHYAAADALAKQDTPYASTGSSLEAFQVHRASPSRTASWPHKFMCEVTHQTQLLLSNARTVVQSTSAVTPLGTAAWPYGRTALHAWSHAISGPLCKGRTVSCSPLLLWCGDFGRIIIAVHATAAGFVAAAQVRIALGFERLLRHVVCRLAAW